MHELHFTEGDCCLAVTVANGNRCVHDVKEKNESALFEFTSCKCHSGKESAKKTKAEQHRTVCSNDREWVHESSERVAAETTASSSGGSVCNKNPAKNAKAGEEAVKKERKE